MNLGKGDFNDGGFFSINGINEFTLSNSIFYDLDIKVIVGLFNAKLN